MGCPKIENGNSGLEVRDAQIREPFENRKSQGFIRAG